MDSSTRPGRPAFRISFEACSTRQVARHANVGDMLWRALHASQLPLATAGAALTFLSLTGILLGGDDALVWALFFGALACCGLALGSAGFIRKRAARPP